MAKRRKSTKSRQAGAPRVGRARKKTPSTDQLDWRPSKFALWSQRWGDPDNDNQSFPTTVLLRHPTAPFRGTARVGTLEQDLHRIAHQYLLTVNNSSLIEPPLGLPAAWVDALNPANPNPWFGWLPLAWPPSTQGEVSALVSFSASRFNATASASDQMIILQASQPTGPGFGIRVVAHVRQLGAAASAKAQDEREIRISGMSACLPARRWLSQSAPRSAAAGRGQAAPRFTPDEFVEFLTGPAFKATIASTINLEESSVAIQGMRLSPPAMRDGPPSAVELTVTGQIKKTDGSGTGVLDPDPYYSFVLATDLTTALDGISHSPLSIISKIELVADAARVFPIDPASQQSATDLHKRRPTRRGAVLDGYRTTTPQIPQILDYAPDGYDDEVVVVCPGFVLDDDGNPPQTPKQVSAGGPLVRSNDASAVMAYWNVKQFFDRLRAYGLPPNQYFRIAPLPLEVRYRSGIRPGPGKDGQTVNARVRVRGFPSNFEGPIKTPGHILQIHLALADLFARSRKPWDGSKRSAAQPLGIAADSRWIWHEIGHVILATSVGELQFRFAHSPGDALAAIASDPESELAQDPNWRGSTFPWVFLPRRHDRCVALGWSWGGTLHHALSQVQDSAGPRRKAYWSEQILSSSLFRLYRCIGGDTKDVTSPTDPDTHARRSASHYCVYLILRAVQILGTSLVVPANEPDQFVSALIDADINTASNAPWQVSFPSVFPVGTTDTFSRIGGCVHKVIRWAFEAQGLYTQAGTITNAPGTPPPVDVFIADRRPQIDATAQIDYGPGSYNPVSLDWDIHQSQTSDLPAWQAGQAAITFAANHQISVSVGNRGTAAATNVAVSVWWHEWPTGQLPPDWDSTSWTPCAPTSNATLTINPGTQVPFGPFAAVPTVANKRYLLLARASCPDDLANIDPATNLPCSQQPTPLIDLVANDNNLALLVVFS
jgi:hypothetical protein